MPRSSRVSAINIDPRYIDLPSFLSAIVPLRLGIVLRSPVSANRTKEKRNKESRGSARQGELRDGSRAIL